MKSLKDYLYWEDSNKIDELYMYETICIFLIVQQHISFQFSEKEVDNNCFPIHEKLQFHCTATAVLSYEMDVAMQCRRLSYCKIPGKHCVCPDFSVYFDNPKRGNGMFKRNLPVTEESHLQRHAFTNTAQLKVIKRDKCHEQEDKAGFWKIHVNYHYLQQSYSRCSPLFQLTDEVIHKMNENALKE
ncbi:hypothetical protein T10_10291 [Trichinella papuae]|uniref:Uncharacterized protein n=1 Tax=Trichinella papuae TaxID=268474 RepID=A0A0V1M6Q8_9BILA|nr:hypothetical protein T10_10291 [Trichinella papuae]